MQIKLMFENLEEINIDSSVIYLKSSISSWIIDYYFTNKYLQTINIIGIYDMFRIFKIVHPLLTINEFYSLCQNKIKKEKNNFIIENYNQYLNRCGLNDIIDIFHQCQLDSVDKTIYLSINNIKNNIDQLFFEYFTNENQLKLIDNQQIDHKDYLKHTLCTYLSLLLDTRNEHALIHCLVIGELKSLGKLSKNEGLTIYQIFLSFIRRKELILNRKSSSLEDLVNNNDKYYDKIQELFDFIEELRIIIEENEYSKIESTITFRKLLELISKQLQKDQSFNQYDLILKEIIEELCQYFQTTITTMNFASPIRSASSEATLAGHRFLRSVSYLCAKQIIDLPLFSTNNDHDDNLSRLTSSSEEKIVDQPKESLLVWQSKIKEKHQSLDLSTIHEISFESDPIVNNEIQSKSMVKRQPLREIDINTFNNEERNIENDKKTEENSREFMLISDGDKENLPMIRKKRLMVSTKNDPPSKKHKTTPEVGQKMITSFFQSTS